MAFNNICVLYVPLKFSNTGKQLLHSRNNNNGFIAYTMKIA